MLLHYDQASALKLAVTAILLAVSTFSVRAQFTFANDNAGNYGGSWTAGSDGGTGFGGWGFSDQSTSVNMGSFIGNPTNSGINPSALGSAAFGLYSVNATAGYANRSRGFDVGMGIGDVFTFDWGMNWDAGNTNGSKGFDIRSGSTNLFTLVQSGNVSPAINFNNNVNSTSGAAANTYGTNNMAVTLTRTASGYTFTMTSRNTGGLFTTNISTSATIDGFNLFTGNQNNADNQRNIFFDNFSITNSGVFTQGGSVTNANTFGGSGNLSIGNNTTLALSGGGNNNYSGATTISNGSALRFQGSGTSDFGSAISGGGTIVVSNGAGQVNLQANNSSFTGNITVANGSLEAQSANALGPGSGTTTVESGGTLRLWNAGGLTYAAETLTINGAGVGSGGALRNITNNNVWQGNITFGSGARINSDNGTLTVTGTLSGGANNMYFGGSGNIALSNTISGSANTGDGAIFKDGTGVLTLHANNTGLNGLVRLREGTISITNANSLGSGVLEFGGMVNTATLLVNSNTARTAALQISNNSTNSAINVASGVTFTNTGSLASDGTSTTTKFGKAGAGSLVLAGASGNTYAGQIQIGDGAVVAGTSTALGTNTSTVNRGIDLGLNIGDASQANNVALRASNGVTVAQSVYVAPNTGNALRTIGLAGAGAATFSNQFYLDGTLTVDGGANATDLVTISGSMVNTGGLNKIGSGTVILSGANTYSGQTTVSNGVLLLTNGSALSDAGVLQLDNTSGASATVAQSETIGSLRGGGATGGSLNISSGATLTVAEATTQNYAGAIGGSGAFAKSGAGQINLSGANTYGGLTTISSGSLEAQSASALGSTNGATTVSSGANLKLYGGGSGISYDAEAVTLNGLGPAYGDVGGDAGALRSVGGGNNTWNGAITLGSNSRINSDSAGGAGSLAIAGSIAGGNNVLFLGTKSSATANMTISGAISGAGAVQDGTTTSLFKDGASTLTLTGNNTFSGDTRISAGNLAVASGGNLGNGTSDVYIAAAGSLAVNANATIASIREWGTTNGGTATIGSGAILTVAGDNWSDFMNSIGGAGNLVKSGTGTMNLYGTQGYTGTTTVSGGRLSTGVALASSGVTVSGGTFETTQANILGDTATVTVNSGTYSLGGDDTVGALSGSGGTLNLGTNRLTSTVGSGVSSSFSGLISSTGASGGLTKAGSGTLVLGGNNTYTGSTVVSAGDLRVNGNQSSATGAVTVAAGATLSGSGTIGGAAAISGFHSPGNSPGVQTFASNLTYNSGSTNIWELTANTSDSAARGISYDGINLGATASLNFAGTTKMSLVFNSAGSSVGWANSFWGQNQRWLVYDLNGGSIQNTNNFSIDVVNWADSFNNKFQEARLGAQFSLAVDAGDMILIYTVPEPSTWALLTLGTGIVASRLLRRRK